MNGCPSDHLCPGRRCSVKMRLSTLSMLSQDVRHELQLLVVADRGASSRRRPSCGCRGPSPSASAARRHSGRASSRLRGEVEHQRDARKPLRERRKLAGGDIGGEARRLLRACAALSRATPAPACRRARPRAGMGGRVTLRAAPFMPHPRAPSPTACARDGRRRHRRARRRLSPSTRTARATPPGCAPRRRAPRRDRACDSGPDKALRRASPSVYGCIGLWNSTSRGAISTMRPRHITAISSAM